MPSVMWGEPGGEIRWQPQLHNGERLWTYRGSYLSYYGMTYWSGQENTSIERTPVLYRSHIIANIRAWIGNRDSRKDWKQL